MLNTEESISWATPCLQSISSKSVQERLLAAKCLKTIFDASAVYPEIYRMLSGTVVPQFIEILAKLKMETLDREGLEQLMETLSICIQVYRGPCFSRKAFIQELLLRNLQNLNHPDSDCLARPFALLAFTCNVKAVSDFRVWNDYMIQALYTTNLLLTDMFTLSSIDDLPIFSNNQASWLHLNSKCSHAVKVLDFSKKFSFACKTIEQLLGQEHESHVKIPVRSVLYTVNRMLSRQISSLNKQTANLDELYSNSVVPFVYQNALLVLRTLFTSCKENLALYINEVSLVFSDILNATETIVGSDNGESRLLKLRTDCYASMQQWFTSIGVYLASFVNREWTDKLLNHFYTDIKYKQTSLKLSSNKKANRNDRLSLKVISAETHCNETQVQLAHAATRCIETYLRLYAPVLSAKHLNKLGAFVLSELMELYQTGLPRQQTYFVHVPARKSLFVILRTLSFTIDDSSFVNNCINLFHMALLADENSDIGLFARESIAVFGLARSRIGTGSASCNLASLADAKEEQSIAINGDASTELFKRNILVENQLETNGDLDTSMTNGEPLNDSEADSYQTPLSHEMPVHEYVDAEDANPAKRIKPNEPEVPIESEQQTDFNANELLSDDEQPISTEEAEPVTTEIPETKSQPIKTSPTAEDLYSEDSSIDDVIQHFVDK
jgi:hypothetical protein